MLDEMARALETIIYEELKNQIYNDIAKEFNMPIKPYIGIKTKEALDICDSVLHSIISEKVRSVRI